MTWFFIHWQLAFQSLFLSSLVIRKFLASAAINRFYLVLCVFPSVLFFLLLLSSLFFFEYFFYFIRFTSKKKFQFHIQNATNRIILNIIGVDFGTDFFFYLSLSLHRVLTESLTINICKFVSFFVLIFCVLDWIDVCRCIHIIFIVCACLYVFKYANYLMQQISAKQKEKTKKL